MGVSTFLGEVDGEHQDAGVGPGRLSGGMARGRWERGAFRACEENALPAAPSTVCWAHLPSHQHRRVTDEPPRQPQSGINTTQRPERRSAKCPRPPKRLLPLFGIGMVIAKQWWEFTSVCERLIGDSGSVPKLTGRDQPLPGFWSSPCYVLSR